MRQTLTALIVVTLASPLLAQTGKSSKKTPPPEPITIAGCVARATVNGNPQYTVDDKVNGKYRLSGLDIHDFLGQRVQLVGGVIETKKLRIQGGLKPSPNLAGQAGAVDQTQIATATAGGQAPTGDVQLPEFRVKSVRPLGAGCE
jgi:hypothetical protein